MWHHFINFLGRSGTAFFESLGSTALGFFAPFIIWLAAICAYEFREYRLHGWAAMKLHLQKTFVDAFAFSVISGFLVYGALFGWSVIKTAYNDHNDLVKAVQVSKVNQKSAEKLVISATPVGQQERISELERELGAANQKIGQLEPKPDRHLTEEQKEKLIVAFKRIAPITPMFLITAPSDLESQQFFMEFRDMFDKANLKTRATLIPISFATTDKEKTSGITIGLRDNKTEIPKGAEALFDALKEAGLNPKGAKVPITDTDIDFVFIVGYNSGKE